MPEPYNFTHNTRFDLNTSCSKDDAIRALLGDELGILREDLRNTEDPRLTEGVEKVGCLEALELLFESAQTRYVNAQNMDGSDLKRLRADLDEAQAELSQYHRYLCDINDELAKGNLSELRVDPGRTKSRQRPYINMISLKSWANKKYGISIFPALRYETTALQRKPRTKMLDQEDAILAEIVRLEHDPESLPKNQAGKDGVKAEVCSALDGKVPFEATTSFTKAWERLRKDGRIREGSTPASSL